MERADGPTAAAEASLTIGRLEAALFVHRWRAFVCRSSAVLVDAGRRAGGSWRCVATGQSNGAATAGSVQSATAATLGREQQAWRVVGGRRVSHRSLARQSEESGSKDELLSIDLCTPAWPRASQLACLRRSRAAVVLRDARHLQS